MAGGQNGASRKCFAAKAAIAVVLCMVTALATTDALPEAVTVQGTLTYSQSSLDGDNGTWRMKDGSTGITYVLPAQPLDAISGNPIEIGARLILTCVPSEAPSPALGGRRWVSCQSAGTALVVAARAPYQSRSVDMPVLAVVVTVQCTNPASPAVNKTLAPLVSTSELTRLFIAPNTSYNAFWSGCSFRTFELDAPNFLAINVTVNDCYYVETANSSCLWQDLGGLVDMQLEGLLGPDVAFNYMGNTEARTVYVLPPALAAPCKWDFNTDMPSNQMYFITSTASNGVRSRQAVTHALLHSFGLWHSAGTTGVVHADSTTPSGNGNGCPCAPEMRRLGWSTPALDIGLSYINLMPANMPKLYDLPALTHMNSKTYLRIRDEVSTPFSVRANYYVEYRSPLNGDALLAASAANKMVVHKVNNTRIDALFNSGIIGDAGLQLLLAAPTSGFTYKLPPYKLLISSNGADGKYLSVGVCKYARTQGECINPRGAATISSRLVGCYKDSGASQRLQLASSSSMTLARCQSMAITAGYAFVSLQNGNECWATNNLQDAVRAGAGNCSALCSGANNAVCGGNSTEAAFSLYELQYPGGGYMGCYVRNPGGGKAVAFSVLLENSAAMTRERCEGLANAQGYTYYGLVQGNVCFGSATLTPAITYGPSYNCTAPCAGNANQTCGGTSSAVVSVYRTDLTAYATGRSSTCSLPGRCSSPVPECITRPKEVTIGVTKYWSNDCLSRFMA